MKTRGMTRDYGRPIGSLVGLRFKVLNCWQGTNEDATAENIKIDCLKFQYFNMLSKYSRLSCLVWMETIS